MALDLSGALELVGDDHQTEVCLGRGAVGHRFVVLVEVGVIVYLDVASKLLDELVADRLLDRAARLGARGRLRHGCEEPFVQGWCARGETQETQGAQ